MVNLANLHRIVTKEVQQGTATHLWWRYVVVWLLLVTAASAHAAAIRFEETPLAIDAEAGQFQFRVEVAATPDQRRNGLMFRESLAEDRGMLFDFKRTAPVTMWMRNTYIALDMLFIHADGRIHRIVENTEPLSDAVISSDGPVRAVLELRAGVTAILGIKPGDYVIHPLFSAP